MCGGKQVSGFAFGDKLCLAIDADGNVWQWGSHLGPAHAKLAVAGRSAHPLPVPTTPQSVPSLFPFFGPRSGSPPAWRNPSSLLQQPALPLLFLCPPPISPDPRLPP